MPQPIPDQNRIATLTAERLTALSADNGRSYDPTAGALAAHLNRLRRRDPGAGNLFRTLGLAYRGPVDGHHIDAVSTELRRAAALRRPVVVHVITDKGHGYPPAEADETDRMHACGVIDPATGLPVKPARPTWTDIFGHEIAAMATARPEVVALTAAMRLPTGLGGLSRQRPEAVFDFGIAEQHLLASAAGLAIAGLHPVVALYSTFPHRAFDQFLLDVALHGLPVTVVLDRTGITGPDGPSHHGMWDLVLLGSVPGMRVACPRDPARLRELLREAVDIPAPAALRYPKAAAGTDIPAVAQMDGLDILHRSRSLPPDVLLVPIGAMAQACSHAAAELTKQGVGVTVVDPRWVWPVNPALLGIAIRHRVVVTVEDVTVEDGIAASGIGTRMIHDLMRTGGGTRALARGLPTAFLAHATRDQILAQQGLTGPGIAASCRSLLTDSPVHITAGRPR